LELLCSFSTLGREQVESGVRSFVTRKYAYLIYYEVEEEGEDLVVLAVRHPARQRPFSDG
jgi:plasmid stabilization system protein ParE